MPVSYTHLDVYKRQEYDLAGIEPAAIETGAVIITGETARTTNADAILAALSAEAGDFVVTVAGPSAESQIAGRGSGVARWSADHYEQVTTCLLYTSRCV